MRVAEKLGFESLHLALIVAAVSEHGTTAALLVCAAGVLGYWRGVRA